MVGPRLSMALAIACLLLAGCTESTAKPKATDPSETRTGVIPQVSVDPERPKGTLDGLVLNEEELPIGFAEVKAIELNATAIADGEGYFSFGQVNAGEYFLVASAAGFKAKQFGASVKEGENTKVNVKLDAVPQAVSHTEVYLPRGYLNCRAMVFSPAGSTNLNSKGTCGEDPLGQDNGTRTGTITTAPGLVAFVGEARWQPTLYTSRVIKLGVGGSGGENAGVMSTSQWTATSGSPLALEVGQAKIEEWSAKDGMTKYKSQPGKLGWALEVGPSVTGAAVDVGVGMAQGVDLAFTLFFVDAPADLSQTRVF